MVTLGLWLPAGAANRRNSVRARGFEGRDVLGLNATDGNDWNRHGARELGNEWNLRPFLSLVAGGFENGSSHAPGCSLILCCDRFFHAVNTYANGYIRRNCARFMDAKRMRRELNSFCADRSGDIHSIVDDEPASGF